MQQKFVMSVHGPKDGSRAVSRSERNKPLPMNLPPKAALKTPALQTLRAAVERQELAPAFGVRASLAPLFIRRSFKARFRGSMREIFRGNLFPSDGERVVEDRVRV